MPRSVDETRREFLLKLARSAVFVAPAVATLRVGPLAAQGKGGAGAKAAAAAQQEAAATSAVTGSLSPTAQMVESPTFQLRQGASESPWAPGTPGQAPPWAAPPPTQSGR